MYIDTFEEKSVVVYYLKIWYFIVIKFEVEYLA